MQPLVFTLTLLGVKALLLHLLNIVVVNFRFECRIELFTGSYILIICQSNCQKASNIIRNTEINLNFFSEMKTTKDCIDVILML